MTRQGTSGEFVFPAYPQHCRRLYAKAYEGQYPFYVPEFDVKGSPNLNIANNVICGKVFIIISFFLNQGEKGTLNK